MRLAHLAALHPGRTFHSYSLLEDQRAALERVVALLRESEAEVLLLAGDLYDRALPGSAAVRLLDDFLREVRDGCRIPVIAIAGNHDSADHLGFGSWLFSRGDVHVRGRVERECLPIVLADRDDREVTFYPLPYVEPEAARELLGVDTDLHHRDVVGALLEDIRAHARSHEVARAVVIAHAFVRGSRPPEESPRSERNLFLGGAGAVPVAEFSGFAYAALGHLHRAQSVDAEGRVRYAGSLLKYSFDEAAHTKGLTLVDLDASGAVTARVVPVTPRRDLATVRGTLSGLLTDPSLAPCEGSFLAAVLTDPVAPLNPMERLRERFPYAAELRFERAEREPAPALSARAQVRDPEAVFTDFSRRYGGGPPDEESLGLFREALVRAQRPEEGP